MAAMAAAAVDDIAPADSFHSSAESTLSFAAKFAGLVGTFHFVFLSIRLMNDNRIHERIHKMQMEKSRSK